MFSKLLKQYKKPTIGLTATPTRLWRGNDHFSGKPVTMSKMLHRTRPKAFSSIISVTQIRELLEGGFWCKPKYDVRDFDTQLLTWNKANSEYTDRSVEHALSANNTRREAVDAAVMAHETYGRRHVLIFTTSIESAHWIAAALGPKAAALSSKTKKRERKRILREFKSGKLSYVVNVEVLTTGFDFPSLDCIILGRPTQSYALYYQMICRGVRPFESKPNCLVIDLVDNFSVFGAVDDMTVYDHPEHGWGIYLGRRIITNVPVNEMKYIKDTTSTRQTIGRGQFRTLAPLRDPHTLPRIHL